MLNRIKFLFTRRLTLWVMQEDCRFRDKDCDDCGGSLWHGSEDFLSREKAMMAAREFVTQWSEDYAKLVVTEDGEHTVFEHPDTDLAARVYRAIKQF